MTFCPGPIATSILVWDPVTPGHEVRWPGDAARRHPDDRRVRLDQGQGRVAARPRLHAHRRLHLPRFVIGRAFRGGGGTAGPTPAGRAAVGRASHSLAGGGVAGSPTVARTGRSRSRSRTASPGRCEAPYPSPNFVIIGAARSGTTSLDPYLAKHPDEFTAPSRRRTTSPGRPRGRPRARRRSPADVPAPQRRCLPGPSDGRGQRAIGEASPRYLHVPGVPEQLAAALPDAPDRHPANIQLAALTRTTWYGRARALKAAASRRRSRPRRCTCTSRLHRAAGRSCIMGSTMPIYGVGSRPCCGTGCWCCSTDDLAADPDPPFARLCRLPRLAEIATADSTVRYGRLGWSGSCPSIG